ncbi:hypothetical protein M5X00_23230 [Paenibacillus alvei]|uniref:DUF5983 domain-containing protein n=1 Tax=Paenibacillus alvei TaxID=44250 RepID=A0ABT4H7L2_PAEAL|nr:hypothetical protein [Paenibacillus alvei]EJW14319.1 hypothetical protein PAV_14c00120 [Paenibacillus alvei DSM 29]MCY9541870.1 hypothetical protein [Paenibacillus alvei]MCY9737309.1 hypothetical protein [Paenibacillus alvei]MCY9757155.1 hypothetical protein [Paenibacillus alvei]MCY9764972.1 hypothetical protein [Paenibacillus alvei]
MKNKVVVLVKMLQGSQDVVTYVGVDAMNHAARAFENWTGIAYSTYLQKSSTGKNNYEILGENYAGTNIYITDAVCRGARCENLLSLSTGHITEEAAKRLENFDFPLVAYRKEDDHEAYGFFLIVPDSLLDPSELPECIQDIIIYAKALECDWINLDRDADVIPDLPVYEFE